MAANASVVDPRVSRDAAWIPQRLGRREQRPDEVVPPNPIHAAARRAVGEMPHGSSVSNGCESPRSRRGGRWTDPAGLYTCRCRIRAPRVCHQRRAHSPDILARNPLHDAPLGFVETHRNADRVIQSSSASCLTSSGGINGLLAQSSTRARLRSFSYFKSWRRTLRRPTRSASHANSTTAMQVKVSRKRAPNNLARCARVTRSGTASAAAARRTKQSSTVLTHLQARHSRTRSLRRDRRA